MLIPTIMTLMNCEGDSRNSDRINAFFDRCFFLSSTDNLLSETKPISTPAKKPANKKEVIIPSSKKVSMFKNILCTLSIVVYKILDDAFCFFYSFFKIVIEDLFVKTILKLHFTHCLVDTNIDIILRFCSTIV